METAPVPSMYRLFLIQRVMLRHMKNVILILSRCRSNHVKISHASPGNDIDGEPRPSWGVSKMCCICRISESFV